MAIEPDFVRFACQHDPPVAPLKHANIIDLGHWAPPGGRNAAKIDDIGQPGMRIKTTYPDQELRSFVITR